MTRRTAREWPHASVPSETVVQPEAHKVQNTRHPRNDASWMDDVAAAARLHTEQIFSLLPDAVIVHRDQQIIFANAAAQRMFGAKPPLSLVGRAPIELVHEADRAQIWSRRFAASQRGFERQRVDTRFVRLDDTEFVGASKGVMVQWVGGPAMLLLVRDVAEHRSGAAEPTDSEPWHWRLFGVAPDPA